MWCSTERCLDRIEPVTVCADTRGWLTFLAKFRLHRCASFLEAAFWKYPRSQYRSLPAMADLKSSDGLHVALLGASFPVM